MTLPLRSVARPVSNLGNTCYMNAVLQALAHAPELCLAMDCQPHRLTCPIAAENALKRNCLKCSASTASSLDDNALTPGVSHDGSATANRKISNSSGTRKSSRRSGSNGGRKSPGEGDSASSEDDVEFCVLCEVENHIRQVHDTSVRDKPFAPRTFVDGFIDRVAPWFQLGVQEDSHEFLRLLIDAMQQSCHRARLQDNPQDDSPRGIEGEEQENDLKYDQEYPFSLFRGTVESNVVCESCRAMSSTLDPIEDVGLEVTIPHHQILSHGVHRNSNSSRNTSPVPQVPALVDVQTAFQRFAQTEALDSGYKCEKCGKVGKATKQSRLARIPPILTLHLKRFSYGDRGTSSLSATTRRSRSEVSQLLGSNDYSTGKSGSSKIEGHIKFSMFFDLKPYLTDKLKATHSNMFCRLFAVIVHAGKNSHSGHYIAFVRNVSKNEWWKMDDSRVTAVSEDEVMQAEAYMLFYRVVQHPIAVQLEELYKKKVFEETVVSSVLEPLNKSQETMNVRPSRKRPLESYENGEEWAREMDFPPHLLGLMNKVTNLIADDIQVSGQYYRKITEEAALHNAVVGKSPRCKITGTLAIARRRSNRIMCRNGRFVKTLIQTITSFLFQPT
jgi:ubiquitin C-terminal hydrolase